MADYYEPQYQVLSTVEDELGLVSLGPMSSFTWNTDPKRLLFVLSRYKFVASILNGEGDVLEVGCGDGFASRIVAQQVRHLTISDIDSKFIKYAKNCSSKAFPVDTIVLNLLLEPSSKKYSAIYLLDVLEHINPCDEDQFLKNIASSLLPNGKVLIGMPSLESQVYASKASKEGHVNCQSKFAFKSNLLNYFSSVFMFSMNDEVVHTGYDKMSHYIFALCTL